jgi:hypothetical protein
MSLFGFSPRGRGQSKSIIHSPLPLSTGNIAFHLPNTNGLSVELPPLPPLPSLPLWNHDNTDEFHSSHKVKSKNTVQSKPKSSTVTTETSPVMPFASSDVHFSGKTTAFGTSLPQSNHSLHKNYNHINTTNLSHLHDTTLHLESTHLQGTDQKFTFILLAF